LLVYEGAVSRENQKITLDTIVQGGIDQDRIESLGNGLDILSGDRFFALVYEL
jgi:hypothetical protein